MINQKHVSYQTMTMRSLDLLASDMFRKDLWKRLESLELTVRQIEEMAGQFRSLIAFMAHYAQKVRENHSSTSPLDEEFLRTAEYLDTVENYLVLVVSKTTEKVEEEQEAVLKDNILISHIDKKLTSIHHFSEVLTEVVKKIMKAVSNISQETSQLKNSLESEDVSGHHPHDREQSLKLHSFMDELNVTDFKISELYSTLVQWKGDRDSGSGADDYSQRQPGLHQEKSLASSEEETLTRAEIVAKDEREKENSSEMMDKSGSDIAADTTLEVSASLELEESHPCPAPDLSASEVVDESAQSRDGASQPCRLGTSIVRDQLTNLRRQQLVKLKEDLGKYSSCLVTGGYEEVNVWYEGGSLDKFWLWVETPALDRMNRLMKVIIFVIFRGKIALIFLPGKSYLITVIILFQQTFSETLTCDVREGDLVLARFPVDGQVYRAKVLAVKEAPDLQTSYDVLYIDYGNAWEDLTAKDLSAWYSDLEMIQPQAHLATLERLPKTWRSSVSSEMFDMAMRAQGGMKMRVHHTATTPHSGTFAASRRDFGEKVELWVSLTLPDGGCVLAALQSFLENNFEGFSQLRRESSRTPPPPIHLEGVEGLPSLDDASLSPVNPITCGKAVKKVKDWLEKNESSQQSVEEQLEDI